ncbi:MAG: pyridoxal-phosphate dependent enzyme [Sphingomonadales bacterium]
MSGKFDNILGTIGNTPVVRINKLGPEGINLYVKIEAFNPMGSVKDRLALGVIEAAEQSGELKPGQTVIEATSGNTGIGLAMVCAAKGYPLVCTMSEAFSVERRKMLRFLGAKVVLTPAAEKGTGMVAKAEELAEKHGWYLTRQFENEANPDIHSRTTAPEILAAFADDGLDYWVTGFGTSGTLKGVARVLKKESPKTKIICCEPDNSKLMASGIAQKRGEDGQHIGSHPNFRPHLMQGWGPDFMPLLAEEILKEDWVDGYLPINGFEALRLSRELAQKEGIFVGITAGATLAGALEVAKDAPKGSNILAMMPDTGERYLSTLLFDDIPEEMTEEEWAVSKSTPGCRFDAPAKPAPKKPEVFDPASPKAKEFVAGLLADSDNPVAMVALEYCEFCWAVRKMLKAYEIPYVSVDIDSAKYQEGGWGQDIRMAVRETTGTNTFPQIFIGGDFVGGSGDLFGKQTSGELAGLLETAGVPYNKDVTIDPFSFLPKWLQPR